MHRSAASAVACCNARRTTNGHVTPIRPSAPARLLIPTTTPCSFSPIIPRQPADVKTIARGPSVGAMDSSTTCSAAVACMSHVCP